MTSLDRLVQRLTEQSLQDQLVELVSHVDGYEEVAALDRGPPGIKLDMFVDDIARLLRAIQRALNALDLDSYGGYHHGCCELHKELCKELRHLRDQAKALTVAQIKSEMVEHIKAKVKEAFDTDILEDLDEDLESRLLELEGMDLDLSAMEKAQVYNVQGSPWEALMSAPELTLEQHTIIKVHPTQEKHEEETVKYPPHEYIVSSTTNTPVTVSKAPATAEDIKASLLGSLGEKLNSLPSGHHAAGIKHPVTHAKPVVEESTKLYVPIVVKKPDDVVHHFDEPTSVENANFISTWAHSVPLWLTKDPESQNGHYKDVVDNAAHEAEQIAVNEAALQVEQVEDPLASYNMLANLIDELQKSTPSPIFDGHQAHHHHHQNAIGNTAAIPKKDTSLSSLDIHKVNADHAPSEFPKGNPSIHPVHTEESHHSRNDDLISTLQNIIGEQMISNENQGKHENEVLPLPGTEFITGTTSSTTVQPTVTVAVRNSWLGSLLGNGYLLTTEATQPEELVETVTEEDNQKGDGVVLAVEDIVDANSAHDPESTGNRTSAVAAVYHSVASWLRKNPEQRTLEDEEIVKDTAEDVEETRREHPINEPKSQLIEEDPVLSTVIPTLFISVEESDKLDSVSSTERIVDDEQDTSDTEFSTEPTTSSISFNDSEEHTEHVPAKSREGELTIPVEQAEEITVDETTLQSTNKEVVELLTADELEQASLTATANQNISTNSSNVHKATTERASSVSSEDQTTGQAADAENGQHSRSDELATAVATEKEAISEENSAATSLVPATTEAAKGSWLGSLLGKGYLLPIRQSTEEVSHPTELMETPELESTSTSSLNNSEEYTEHASVEFREGELSIPDETVEEILEGTLQSEDEDVFDLITVDKVEEAIPAPVPGQEMSTNSSMIHEMTTERSSPESSREEDQHSKNDELATDLKLNTGAETISEENLGREEHIALLPVVSTTTEAARESWLGSLFGKGYLLPIGQTTDEVSQPPGLVEAVTDEDNKRGDPSVEEVVNAQPAESTSNRTSAVSAVYNSVASWLRKSPEQQKVTADDQAKVDDEKARELSVDEPAADEQPILTNATFDSDVRGFIRNEIANVLTSLEETNGFTDLKEHILDQDVDHLVQSLSDVKTGVRWTEMISGLQKLVADKQLDNAERIVDALAQWKKSEDEQVDDDGYFERVYGVDNDAEGRSLDVEENIDLVSIQESATDDHTNNETTEIHSNVSTSTESQQIDNENERQKVGRSTEEPSVEGTSNSKSTLPEDEISEKLGKTTPQPFRADET